MLNTLRPAIYVNPVIATLPGVMIFITSICFNLMSDGLRAAMDVKENRAGAAALTRKLAYRHRREIDVPALRVDEALDPRRSAVGQTSCAIQRKYRLIDHFVSIFASNSSCVEPAGVLRTSATRASSGQKMRDCVGGHGKPGRFSFGTVSGAGNSAQSTAPDNSAAARAEASGIGSSIIRA